MHFAINGFGRIGRCILRAFATSNYHNSLNCVAINIGEGNIKNYLHLLKYDSTHGIFTDVDVISDDVIKVAGQSIKIISEKDPEKIKWSDLGAEIVLECTGAFTKRNLSAKHLTGGAQKVVVSAPCDKADITVVYGVNEKMLNKSHHVISIGSCTTNCLAPIAKVLNDNIGIERGFMTTIHAYTNDQRILDTYHDDKRRARAAALSMIPTSTGAAKALGLILPELIGKLDGASIRVPVQNVSLIDLTFTSSKPTSKEEINKLMLNAQNTMTEILEFVDEELVSIDFNRTTKSCIFDATQTRVVDNTFCRIAAWYDNEWAFSHRMLDITKILKDYN